MLLPLAELSVIGYLMVGAVCGGVLLAALVATGRRSPPE